MVGDIDTTELVEGVITRAICEVDIFGLANQFLEVGSDQDELG